MRIVIPHVEQGGADGSRVCTVSRVQPCARVWPKIWVSWRVTASIPSKVVIWVLRVEGSRLKSLGRFLDNELCEFLHNGCTSAGNSAFCMG